MKIIKINRIIFFSIILITFNIINTSKVSAQNDEKTDSVLIIFDTVNVANYLEYEMLLNNNIKGDTFFLECFINTDQTKLSHIKSPEELNGKKGLVFVIIYFDSNLVKLGKYYPSSVLVEYIICFESVGITECYTMYKNKEGVNEILSKKFIKKMKKIENQILRNVQLWSFFPTYKISDTEYCDPKDNSGFYIFEIDF